MNPFDLKGPEFLAFYLVFAAVVLLGQIWFRRRAEGAGRVAGRLTDPYAIAYLRRGAAEALKVAAVSMVDRGLLRHENDRLVAAEAAATHPLERAILERFASPGTIESLLESPSLADDQLRPSVEKLGLVPDDRLAKVHRLAGDVEMGLLAAVAGFKVLVGISRGRPVVFLVFLGVAAIFVAHRVARPRLTRRGRELLRDLDVLFAGLRARADRIQPGGATHDATYLAAVFGVGLLTAQPAFARLAALAPKPAIASGGDGGGGGSSCGSSCGGGCGGGCGGCGS